MALVCWDFIIKNDVDAISQVKQKFHDLKFKFVQQIYNEKISLFFFIWETDLGWVWLVIDRLRLWLTHTLEKTHISMNIVNKDAIQIIKWSYDDVCMTDNIVCFDVMPNYDIDFIKSQVLDYIFTNPSIKLAILQTTYNDDYFQTENYRLTIIV